MHCVCGGEEAVIVKEIGAIKEMPDLHWDKGKAVLGKDSTQLSFQLVKVKAQRIFCS